MELEGECSATGAVEVSETVSNSNSEKLGAYGNCVNEHDNESMETKGKGFEVTEEAVAVKSTTPSPTTKGYGLRKWKRINRGEVKKDGDSNIDTSKLIVKRDLSSSSKNSAKSVRYSAGTSQQSSEFVSLIGNSVAVHGSAFMAGEDLENSEDQSSDSASNPPRNKKPAGNKNLANLSQQSKDWTESSKKLRGERVKIDKENSHSSMESDSRSSNFVFMQGGTSSLKSNGTKGERPLNSDGENRDEDKECEGKVGDDDLQASYNDGNTGQFEDVLQEGLSAESSWEAKDEKSENQGTSTDHDPVIGSIFTLQTAQEALEREVQKFKEIAKEAEHLEPVNGMQDSFDSLENEVISQKQVLKLTESKLEEATSMLTLKDAKVNELESIISNGPRTGERQTAMQPTLDIETELETLFKQKIETEVEFLVSKAAVSDQITLLEQQKALASDNMVNKLGDAEQKAEMLKKEAEKLENYCKNMVSSADDTLKLQKSVFKHTFCFCSQLILLVLVVGLFIFQLSPHHLTPVVPT
ncbi:PREDICTED: WPP domain-interacting protein 2 isoform X2 [Ipomoea nil]|uniref:WPP domain-interacting protein 2 isoform X2 n=1 Tax=Ipomoea nil TaxID=35883 RepID=UPI0009017C50|nr:PREDICTED: WPP domain-interacting protein 2 isoform X2 [Ipomoea nil]